MMQTKYRADIDGLRALAILLVIAYHTSSYRAPGGFIGVDIFFVISGFLISSIIFTRLDKGVFSYSDFYARRIKRIFPALLAMLLVAWVLGYVFLFSHEFEQLGKHMASGLAFVANITLWNEAGYFDNTAESKPLLHLWSLGVEEQFYILYPLIVAALWRVRANVPIALVVLSLVSFLLNLYWVNNYNMETAFYLPFSRFWELMSGGLLAYIALYTKVLRFDARATNILAFLGLGLIAMGFTTIDGDVGFPGWWALMPIIGSVFLLSVPQSWLNRNLLASKPMVMIGLISYPLYLWHWLLLSLVYILKLDSGVSRLVAVVTSVFLAWFTYTFIENNVRYRKGATIYVLIALSITLFSLALITASGNIKPHHDSAIIQKAVLAVVDWDYPNNLDEIKVYGEDVFWKKGSDKRVLFFGDSHIEQYAPRIVSLINENPKETMSAVFATRGACPPIPNVFRQNLRECTSVFRKAMLSYAASSEVDAVVIGARWEFYLDKDNPYQETFSHFYIKQGEVKKYLNHGGVEDAKQALKQMLAQLVKHKKVYLVLDNPDIQALDPKAFLSKQRFASEPQVLGNVIAYTPRQLKLHDEMKAMAEALGVVVIDPIPHFCPQLQCKTTMQDGSPLYKDANHIRASYMRDFVDYIDITVKEP